MMNTEKLIPGTRIKLEFDNRQDERYTAYIIGYSTGQSISITAPISLDNKVVLIRQDQPVTIRYFVDTVACGFESTVIKVCNTPYPYLHLAYPGDIHSEELRREKRIRTRLNATWSNRLEQRAVRGRGEILDLSVHGLSLSTPDKLGEVGDTIDIMATLPVGKIERLFTTSAIIRSFREVEQQSAEQISYLYGMEFNNILEDDYILISAYVNSELIS